MKKKLIFILFIIGASHLYAQDQRVVLENESLLIPKLGSKENLPTHKNFNSFIQTYFNKPGPFHGPNCYNTALIASGYLNQKNIRYISPEEFEEILKVGFKEVTVPSFKDIIVFDAKSSRGHVGYYLGDNLVFHKKSYATHYHYRISTLRYVGRVEENEWQPGPVDDSSLQMNWPELGQLPQKYYRLKSDKKPLLEKNLAALINSIEAALLKDLGQWSIAKKWGMAGEYFLEDLITYAKTVKANNYTIAVLISLKDQVYTMLEEVNFKNARNPQRVMSELCVPEQTEQLFQLIREFGKIHKKSSNEMELLLNELKNQDSLRCNYRIVPQITSRLKML